jgi:nucleoside diphosphate kinase
MLSIGDASLIEKKHYSTHRQQTLHHQWTTGITSLIEKKHYSTHRQQTLHHQWTTYITSLSIDDVMFVVY